MAATVSGLRRVAAARLAAAGIDTPLLDAGVLLGAVLNIDPSRIPLEGERPLAPEHEASFAAMVARRLAREPVAYITGAKEFAGLTMRVTRDVLAPRPETELLVDVTHELLAATPTLRVIEVGTGSGAVAVALARAHPNVSVIATDRSAAALRVAALNARDHRVAGRLRLVRTDWFAGVDASGAIVAANLPYVPRASIDRLQPEIARWEPRAALDGGPDGLAAFRRLFARLRQSPPLACVLEIGAGQRAAVVALAAGAGFRCSRIALDLAGRPRVVVLHPGGSIRPRC